MRDIPAVIKVFRKAICRELPKFAKFVVAAEPDEFSDHVILNVPWPRDPGRSLLIVMYRGDCFEVSFSVAGTRGPAERQIIIDKDLAVAVTVTVGFLSEIVSGQVLVDVVQYRILWFQPYRQAFFRQASASRPSRKVVETLRWN